MSSYTSKDPDSLSLRAAVSHARAQADIDPALYTGSPHVDAVLGSPSSPGLLRGTLSEMSGTPGSGRTAVALSLSADALRRGHSVLWITSGGLHYPVQD